MQWPPLRLVGCDGGALRGPLPGPQKMKTPRLAPGGVGRGCFISCRALCGALWDVLERGNIRTLTDIKTALRACKWPLRRFCFFASPLPRWTRAQKCRLRASGLPTSGEKLLEGIGNMGKRKPAPGKPRAGAGGIQDFFAVSQIIMIGRAKINRIIKRGSPPPRKRNHQGRKASQRMCQI